MGDSKVKLILNECEVTSRVKSVFVNHEFNIIVIGGNFGENRRIEGRSFKSVGRSEEESRLEFNELGVNSRSTS